MKQIIKLNYQSTQFKIIKLKKKLDSQTKIKKIKNIYFKIKDYYFTSPH